MFMILDVKLMQIFYTDNWKKIAELQDEANIHTAYDCELLMDDDGLFWIDDGCGVIKSPKRRLIFIEYIKERD